ncbi:glycosyltransferase [Mycetocola zhadangensis]|uniref:Glycosyltransferase n=1 Tax=Mycetocola zhadangensis TaxID=1164595 RepID=A0A3L7J872_9MICO|nr:nucleotide disphospho-sugar-binding domain-containing protein [Mycetocola zhadangensis]RLQ86565.1 glycosyltransferase [Mycetocola zhadangensis]
MTGDDSPHHPHGTPPRRYLFALIDAGGTVPPELGVARRLVDRGHEVTVLADETLAEAVRRTGAAYLPRATAPSGTFRDWNLTPLALARTMADHMMVGPAPDQAADTLMAIDAVQPDLVVASSLAVGAMVAAEVRGVPFDLLIPNVYPFPAEGMPPFGAGLAPARGPFGPLRDRIFSTAGVRLFDRYALPGINTLRSEYSLAPIPTTWAQMRFARRHLILTSRSFDFPARMPENARYVGPILDDPAWAATQPWIPPAGDEPLVLVAMSSTFQNHVGCMQKIVDALSSLPVRAVVTTGPAVPTNAISAPAHVSVVSSAPHGEVLRQAALVVTHGGHGTVVKTLAAGVPLLVLPHGRDQSDNAVRVTTRGAGIALSRRAGAPRMARAATTILTRPIYREAAERLGKAIAHDAEHNGLIEELEQVQ